MPQHPPVTPPVTPPPVVETPPHRPDSRGQDIFSLTPEEVADYRSKIHFLGCVFCIIGALFTVVILVPPRLFGWYKISPLAWLSFGAFGVIFGLALIITGTGLIRLKPGSRIPGIVLSVIVLFFPFATNYHSLNPVIGLGCIIIGLTGIFWLAKRGSVLNTRPDKPLTRTSDAAASSRGSSL